MRTTLLLLLLSVIYKSAIAQDKIITSQQDTIECRIISISTKYILYETDHSDSEKKGNKIKIRDVNSYSRVSNGNINDKSSNLKFLKSQRMQYSLKAGLAHLLTDYSKAKENLESYGNSLAAINDYYDDLNNGLHVGVDIHYFLKPWLGVGIDYTFATFSTSGTLSLEQDMVNNVQYINTSERNSKTFIHFIGASTLFQQLLGVNKKLKLTEIFSPGFIAYVVERRHYERLPLNNYQYGGYQPNSPPKSQWYYTNSNVLENGQTFALKGGLSLEYHITEQLSSGISGSYTWAKLDEISVTDYYRKSRTQEMPKSFNISRIDFGITIRYIH